ncbi:hypothetical protein FACS1894110_25300 [Spirochaetia bacterium]|nr:hypothetical protein FACS1894110_25300 [Spirochaetia bacterium]
MEIANAFFEYLSERMRNENNLSDITWALCCSSDEFRKIFIEYCFEEDIQNIETFVREYSRDDCRPDFFIDDKNGQEYIIEVKIYDRNNHFEQYDNVFKNAKKAFIANYYFENINGWKIKTWKEFLQTLEKKFDEFSQEEVNLIRSYYAYTKLVINYVEVKPMNLSNVSSIKDFYNILQQVVEECNIVKLHEWNQTKSAFTCNEYGKYLWYESGKNKYVYFWIGLHFEDEKIYIYVQYKDKGYCPDRVAKILTSMEPGDYYDELIPDDPYIWIPLKEQYHEQLCKKTNVENQKEIIKKFMEEVLIKLQ